jgi:hypothetical protein
MTGILLGIILVLVWIIGLMVWILYRIGQDECQGGCHGDSARFCGREDEDEEEAGDPVHKP